MCSLNSWIKTLLLFRDLLKVSGFFPTSPRFPFTDGCCAVAAGCCPGSPPLPLPPPSPLPPPPPPPLPPPLPSLPPLPPPLIWLWEVWVSIVATVVAATWRGGPWGIGAANGMMLCLSPRGCARVYTSGGLAAVTSMALEISCSACYAQALGVVGVESLWVRIIAWR